MSNKEYPEQPSHLKPFPAKVNLDDYDWDLHQAYEGSGDLLRLDLRPVKDEPQMKSPIEKLLEDKPVYKPQEVLRRFEEVVDFRQHAESHRWEVGKDVFQVLRHLPGGKLQTYFQKLEEERSKKPTTDRESLLKASASFGEAAISKQRFALYEMHWDFFAGSLGVVEVEKFVSAVDLAIRNNWPLVSVFTSSGVRQQENAAGVFQMERMVSAIEEYKSRSKKPYIGILLGQTWGGVSASAVPQADVLIGYAGTNYGFSGPRVIENYENAPVPEGAQSVEAHTIYRNVDVMANNMEEFINYLHDALMMTRNTGKKLTPEYVMGRFPSHAKELYNRFGFDKGFSPYVQQQLWTETMKNKSDLSGEFVSAQVPADDYELYLDIRNNPNRADTEYLLRAVFQNVVPLYSSHIVENAFGKAHNYPAIIAAFGRIGPQKFLVVGNQPSYQQTLDGRIVKRTAGPGPEDFIYLKRMLEMGSRLELPVVFLTDTLGAVPKLTGEQRGISADISNGLKAAFTYPNPVLTYVIGGMGSGGGLVTTPIGDNFEMVRHSSAVWVAEPRSAASILYNVAYPTEEQVKQTAISLHGSAEYLSELGILDGLVVSTVHQGQGPVKEVIAMNLQRSIVQTLIHLQHMTDKDRLKTRHKRYRNFMGGIEVVKEVYQTESHE